MLYLLSLIGYFHLGQIRSTSHLQSKLFEKNGLDVEVLYLESALVQRALIAGNIDYGEMTGSLMAAPK